MGTAYTAKTPADVVAAVPFILGFQPTDDLIVISVGGGPTARVDMPHDGDGLIDVAATLGAAYRQHPGRVVLVAVTPETRDAIDAFTALTAIFDGICEVADAIVTHNDTWTRLDGATGTINADTHNRVAAEFIGRGVPMPAASRSARSFDLRDGDHDSINDALTTLPAPSEQEAAWTRQRVAEFTYTHEPLTDEDAARMLRNCTDPDLRDTVLLNITRESAADHRAMWRDLTRRAPATLLPAPAALLALTSWLTGDGAAAWDALDLLDGQRPYPLATIVRDLLDNTVDPRRWDELRPTPAAAS